MIRSAARLETLNLKFCQAVDTATLNDTAGDEGFRAYPDKAILQGEDMFS